MKKKFLSMLSLFFIVIGIILNINTKNTLADELIYKMGLLSDIHIDGDGNDETDSINDFKRASKYLVENGAHAIAISGDITCDGRWCDINKFKQLESEVGKSVWTARGNHDTNNDCSEDVYINNIEPNGLYYTKEVNGDLYVFLGLDKYDKNNLFSNESLDWLESILESNKNKRIFLFEHVHINPVGNYNSIIKNYDMGNEPGTTSKRFRDIINSYDNVILFTGHTHQDFEINSVENNRVHISSCAKPRNPESDNSGSQGYLMEVYKNKIILKAINFADNNKIIKEYTINTVVNESQLESHPVQKPEPKPELKPEPEHSITVSELKGVNRYETATLISQQTDHKNVAVLVSGNAIVDGLCSSALAGYYNAPILLTPTEKIDEITINELNRLNIENVIIVGGEGVVSNNVIENLKSLGMKKIIRLGGKDRYETSQLVTSYIDKYCYDVENIFVTGGFGEADCMSASPISVRESMPILLINNNNLEYVNSLNLSNTYIVGGAGIVSKDIENELLNYNNTYRLAGDDRYITNEVLVRHFFENSENIYATKGINLIDALTTGPLAGKNNDPIILINENNGLSNDQKQLIDDLKVNNIIKIGGVEF